MAIQDEAHDRAHEKMMETFLESIRAYPLDSAPRLIFADWLQDNGELEYAEFIRLQFERKRVNHIDISRMWWFRRLCRHLNWHIERVGCCHAPNFIRLEYHGNQVFVINGFPEIIHWSVVNWLRRGPHLTQNWPVCRVWLPTRLPREFILRGTTVYAWSGRQLYEDDAYRLPEEIYELLQGRSDHHMEGLMKFFRSAAEAQNALSLACIRYANSQELPHDQR